MSSFIDDVKGAVSRVKPMRRDKSDDVNESIFNRFLDFSRNIRKRPAPVQLGVGALAGMITGYIFTKGSKVTAAFIGTGLLAFQFCNHQGYIKVNRKKIESDFAKLRNSLEERFVRDFPSEGGVHMENFFHDNAYVLGGFIGGWLLGYGFA